MCFTDVSGVTSRSILFKTEGKAKKSDSIEMRLFSKYEFISLAYFFSSSELEVKSTGSMLYRIGGMVYQGDKLVPGGDQLIASPGFFHSRGKRNELGGRKLKATAPAAA